MLSPIRINSPLKRKSFFAPNFQLTVRIVLSLTGWGVDLENFKVSKATKRVGFIAMFTLTFQASLARDPTHSPWSRCALSLEYFIQHFEFIALYFRNLRNGSATTGMPLPKICQLRMPPSHHGLSTPYPFFVSTPQRKLRTSWPQNEPMKVHLHRKPISKIIEKYLATFMQSLTMQLAQSMRHGQCKKTSS